MSVTVRVTCAEPFAERGAHVRVLTGEGVKELLNPSFLPTLTSYAAETPEGRKG